jgi:hypothetical protein
MLRIALRWSGVLALAVASVVGVDWVAGDPMLGGAIGLCLGTVLLLVLRIRREYPDRATGDTWADKRWTGLSNAVVLFAGLVGTIAIPVPTAYEFALSLLVILAGLVGYLAGSLAEMDRDRVRRQEKADAAPADD